MRKEDELILLTCAINKNKEEKRIEEILSTPVDWGYIIGQLIHHRLTGYFMKGLPEECNRFLFKEVKNNLI